MNITKIDDNTIEVTKTIPEEVIPEKEVVAKYDIKFLKEQKIRVQEDLDIMPTKQEQLLTLN